MELLIVILIAGVVCLGLVCLFLCATLDEKCGKHRNTKDKLTYTEKDLSRAKDEIEHYKKAVSNNINESTRLRKDLELLKDHSNNITKRYDQCRDFVLDLVIKLISQFQILPEELFEDTGGEVCENNNSGVSDDQITENSSECN